MVLVSHVPQLQTAFAAVDTAISDIVTAYSTRNTTTPELLLSLGPIGDRLESARSALLACLSPSLSSASSAPSSLSLPDEFFARRAHHFGAAVGATSASAAAHVVQLLRNFDAWVLLHSALRHSPSALHVLSPALSSVDWPAVLALAQVIDPVHVSTFVAQLLPSQRSLAWRALSVLAHMAHSADARSLPLPTLIGGLVGALVGDGRLHFALLSGAAFSTSYSTAVAEWRALIDAVLAQAPHLSSNAWLTVADNIEVFERAWDECDSSHRSVLHSAILRYVAPLDADLYARAERIVAATGSFVRVSADIVQLAVRAHAAHAARVEKRALKHRGKKQKPQDVLVAAVGSDVAAAIRKDMRALVAGCDVDGAVRSAVTALAASNVGYSAEAATKPPQRTDITVLPPDITRRMSVAADVQAWIAALIAESDCDGHRLHLVGGDLQLVSQVFMYNSNSANSKRGCMLGVGGAFHDYWRAFARVR